MKQFSHKTTSGIKGDILVLGGTGKTGSRIVAGLQKKGFPVRIGSRSTSPYFDWNNEKSWDACIADIEAMYICYSPDLAIPGATDKIHTLVDRAKQKGVKRLVLLSGRGESEAQACERIVQKSGLEWTIVRSSWFYQNFSEGAFADMVVSGQIILPADDTPEPFVDVDDVAEVAVAALTEPGHTGKIYEVTGPRLMTFADIAGELSQVSDHEVTFMHIPHDTFTTQMTNSGAPEDVVWILDYLFSTVLDGRNSFLCNGVQKSLGRPPKDFVEYARENASSGIWKQTETVY